MKYLFLFLCIALLGVVVLMAGDKEKGLQVARNIGLAAVGLIVMAFLLSIVFFRR